MRKLTNLFKKIISFLFSSSAENSHLNNHIMNKKPQYKMYSIGDYSYGPPEILFPNDEATLTIGKYVSIANDVKIMLGGEHRPDWITTYPLSYLYPEHQHIKGIPKTKGNVVIGNDVWIGRETLIMSGITIGDGAVIAANAVVVKNVLPYSIVGGNPARHIRFRFTDEEITRLLQIQWWNWPDDVVRAATPILMSGDLNAVFAFHDQQILTKTLD